MLWIETYMILPLKKIYNNYFTFVPCPKNLTDWEELLFMSLSTHFIIANSTFSWWGAFLSTSTIKTIIYPKQWFGPIYNTKNTTDLFPIGWIKL